MNPAEDLIRRYYEHFNARRLHDAAQLFLPDATLDYLPAASARHGADAYLHFATAWLTAFPDARFDVEGIHTRTLALHDVDAIATGTHTGTLEFGTWIFRPTGAVTRFRVRELLEVHDSRIASGSLSLDVQDLVRQLTRVDVTKVGHHLARLQRLHDELTSAAGAARHREVLEAIGRELDAARHAVRPYFK